jgi:RND family efflux transporter MFP subunit
MPALRRSRFVFLLLVASLALPACGKKPNPSGEVRPTGEVVAAPVPVSVAAAAPFALPRTLRVNGPLVADQQSDVTGVVPGRVVETYVERGSVVAEGDPLVRLRDVDYRLQAAAATAAVQQAEARLGVTTAGGAVRAEETAEVRAAAANDALARESLRRAEQLAETGALSQAELDRARAGATAAHEQYNAALNGMRGAALALSQARVALSQASTAVRETIVRAPFAGEIADRFADVGEYVAPQMRLVSLVKTDPLRIELPVPQERVGVVQRGQAVEIRVDAFPDRVFAGTVRYISAAVRPDTRSLTVEATVPNTDGTLRPGMYATASIDLGGTSPGVSVPAAAVLRAAGVNRVFVVKDDGTIEERVISVVSSDGMTVTVSEGVRAGEKLAVESLERLADGVRVTVRAAAANR